MLRRIFMNPDVPADCRANFIHLYFDAGWLGILSGSAVGFLNVYLTRLGASSLHIGLLGATGAVVSFFLAIPTGHWLERRPIGRAVFWTSVAQRLFYLAWIPLPWWINAREQVWAMIIMALLMAIPATALGLGFTALYASAIPPLWRAPVAGIRNIVLSITFMLASIGSGLILDHLPFPGGYQVVFAIGAAGALMSSLHLYFVRPIPVSDPHLPQPPASPPVPPAHEVRREGRSSLRLDVWKTPFGAILAVMLIFTLAQNLALPLFPIYFVRILELTDTQIGSGTSVFYLTMLMGSTQLARLVRRFGHHRVTAWGSMAMCLYPVILAFAHTSSVYFVLQAVGGFVWSMVSGAQANYLLENIPANDRPAYLAWYTVIANASILAGSLLGPVLAGWMGINLALVFFGGLRFLGGVAILKWGRRAGNPSAL